MNRYARMRGSLPVPTHEYKAHLKRGWERCSAPGPAFFLIFVRKWGMHLPGYRMAIQRLRAPKRRQPRR